MTAQRETKQIQAIRQAFQTAGRPLSIDELHQDARRTIASLGLRTVYRGVRKLQDAGEVTAVPVAGGSDRYELTSVAAHHHHHFHCTACDRFSSMSMAALAGWPNWFRRASSWSTTNSHSQDDVTPAPDETDRSPAHEFSSNGITMLIECRRWQCGNRIRPRPIFIWTACDITMTRLRNHVTRVNLRHRFRFHDTAQKTTVQTLLRSHAC